MAAILMPAPAWAGCVTPAETTARVLTHVPGSRPVTQDPAAAAPLVALFNATPPATAARADRVVVYLNARLTVVLVVLFRDGCRIGAVRMPRDSYLALIRATLGVDS